jgi:hypothetical protein
MVLQLPSFIRYDFVLIEVHFIRTLLLCLPSGSADDGSDSVVYSELFSTFLNISPTIYMPDLLKLITSRFPQVVKLIRRLREPSLTYGGRKFTSYAVSLSAFA